MNKLFAVLITMLLMGGCGKPVFGQTKPDTLHVIKESSLDKRIADYTKLLVDLQKDYLSSAIILQELKVLKLQMDTLIVPEKKK